MSKRPLLDRLQDLRAALRLDHWVHFEADVADAIEEIERLQKLTEAVDVQVGGE